jgi:hypothetical protein
VKGAQPRRGSVGPPPKARKRGTHQIHQWYHHQGTME